MKHFVILFMACAVASAITVDDCPSNLKRDRNLLVYGDKCYRLEVAERKNFFAADEFCRQNGGHLVRIKSKDVDGFLQPLIENYQRPFWIGLRYNKNHLYYQWWDTSPMVYTNFPNQGLSENNECAALVPPSGMWKSFPCKTGHEFFNTGRNPFICEHPPSMSKSEKDQVKANCPPNIPRDKYLKLHGDKCYRFVVGRKEIRSKAKTYCHELGGNLVFLKSKPVNDFIQKELTETYKRTDQPVWIGLVYSYSDRKFHWDDGEVVTYANFQKALYYYVNLFSHLCSGMIPESGKWKNFPCMTFPLELFDEKRNFVCEFAAVLATTTIIPPQPTISTTKEHEVTTGDERCPRGLWRDRMYVKVHGQNCYRFEVLSRSYFNEAESICEQDGGSLAVIQSQDTNEFLVNQLRHEYGFSEHNVVVWIGLRFHTKSHKFEWVDGTDIYSYTHFGQSSFYAQSECVGLNATDGLWRLYKCKDQFDGEDAKQFFVCQYSLKASSSTPSPLYTLPPPSLPLKPQNRVNKNIDIDVNNNSDRLTDGFLNVL